jgi:hypothetical protein
MFRLIRTVIIAMIALVAGVLYERSNAQTDCGTAGGDWSKGRCYGAVQ